MTPAWPEELRFSAEDKALHIRFDDAATFRLPYTYLRRESPSAEVQGHGGGPKPPPPIIAEDIMIERAEAVGRYAVRLYFSDGHSSGLYTWRWLRDLGERYSAP